MEGKCRFATNKGDCGYAIDPYVCYVEGIVPGKKIKSFTGIHEAGKTNNDVIRLILDDQPVGFVPRYPTSVFPNLKYLSMWGCGIKEISRADLQGLEDIEVLNFGGNKLTSLPDDLFDGMKKLRTIHFQKNQIERMSSTLLLPIKETLGTINFENNKRINFFFNAKSDDLAKFMRTIDEKCLPPASQADSVFSKFSSFKTSGAFTDFTIKVRDKEFKFHKAVFAAQSPVFKSIFTDGTKDLSQSIDSIKNYSDETFGRFVDYFYTGKVEKTVNAMEMFELAAVFQVRELKMICSARIVADLNEKNAIEVFNIGHLHQSDELKQKSFEIVKKMFPGLKDSFVEKSKVVNDLVELKDQMNALKTQMDAILVGS